MAVVASKLMKGIVTTVECDGCGDSVTFGPRNSPVDNNVQLFRVSGLMQPEDEGMWRSTEDRFFCMACAIEFSVTQAVLNPDKWIKENSAGRRLDGLGVRG